MLLMRIWTLLASTLVVARASEQCKIPEIQKQKCGYAGITQAGCEAEGCCWQEASRNNGTPSCFIKLPDTLTFIDHSYVGHRFQDKNAIVFGGTSGMGFATAAMLLQECASKVVVVSRNHMQGKLAAWVLSNISQAHCDPLTGGPGVQYVRADISKRQDVRSVFKLFSNIHLHHVVNTAAIPGFIGGLQDLPDDFPLGENDAILNNVYGAIFVSSEAMRFWRLRSCNANGNMPCPVSGVALTDGYVPSLVHVSSEQGMTPCPECVFYGTSKHGIIGLTTSLASAYGPGSMRANVVLPGLVNTPFSWNQVRGIEMLTNGSWTQQYQLQSSWQCVKNSTVLHANCQSGGSGYGCPCEDVRADDPRIKAIWPSPLWPLISPRQIGSAILNFLDDKSNANGMSFVSNKQPARKCQEQTTSGVPIYDLCPAEHGLISRLI